MPGTGGVGGLTGRQTDGREEAKLEILVRFRGPPHICDNMGFDVGLVVDLFFHPGPLETGVKANLWVVLCAVILKEII